MPIIAGGVAFFGFLSIFPALIALLSLYGLVATPETVARQVEDLSAQLPESAAQIIEEQLNAIVANSGRALTVGLLVSSSPRSGARRAASATSSPRSTWPTTRSMPATSSSSS